MNLFRRSIIVVAIVGSIGASAKAEEDFVRGVPRSEYFTQVIATANNLQKYDVLASLKRGCGSTSFYPNAISCYSKGIQNIQDNELLKIDAICAGIDGVHGRSCYERALGKVTAPIYIEADKIKRVFLAMCAAEGVDGTLCFSGALQAAKGEFEAIFKKCDNENWIYPTKTACFKRSLGG